MRVRFVQSGGYLGTVKGCELDTEALDPGPAEELQRLVQRSGLTSPIEAHSAAGRDLKQYEITFEEGAHKFSAVLDDATVPQTAKPLVAYLKKCARPMPLD